MAEQKKNEASFTNAILIVIMSALGLGAGEGSVQLTQKVMFCSWARTSNFPYAMSRYSDQQKPNIDLQHEMQIEISADLRISGQKANLKQAFEDSQMALPLEIDYILEATQNGPENQAEAIMNAHADYQKAYADYLLDYNRYMASDSSYIDLSANAPLRTNIRRLWIADKQIYWALNDLQTKHLRQC